MGRCRANLAVRGRTDEHLGGWGPASLCQQHLFVNDPSGQVVYSGGAANTVNFF